MIETLILSVVQGVTEFIPVSSSSHLFLFSDFLNFQSKSLSIDVSLHIGSFIAIVTYFYKDIINFVKNKDLFIKIIISSIPVMVIGFILIQTNLIENLRNIKLIAWTTILFGFLLYFSDKYNVNKTIKNNFNIKSAIIIGIFQIISLIPGVSRSGITITAARLLNFKRVDATKISFLLSIPTLGAVSVFGVKNILTNSDISFSILNAAAIFLSFLFSYLTIKYFLDFVKKFNLTVFVIYRVILGLALLALAYL